MKHLLFPFTIGIVCSLFPCRGLAQCTGSVTSESGFTLVSGGTTGSAAETVFLGPGTFQIDGTWEIYCKYIWISPDAIITGDGVIAFHNLGDANPTCASPLYIDANNVKFDVNVEMLDDQNMILADMTDPGYGNDLTGNASLYLGRNFSFGVNGGDVILGLVFNDPSSENTTVANTSSTLTDFILDSDATLSGYGSQRFVVTNNSIQGHVVKESYTGSFTYPVGIAEGDYTPATVAPSSTLTVHVGVTDYAAAGAIIQGPQEGMDRAWHIYGNSAVATDITLQHNAGTDGAEYLDDQAFITQYEGDSVWSSSPTTDFVSAGVHTRSGIVLSTSPAASESWFSKANDPITPLPISLLHFSALCMGTQVEVEWTTASEINNAYFGIGRSSDLLHWETVASIPGAGNSNELRTYHWTDQNPLRQVSYYRLSQTDYNGDNETFEAVSVQCNGFGSVASVYPNPTAGQITVSIQGPEVVNFQLTDMMGRAVYTQTLFPGEGQTLLEIFLPENLPAATYHLRLSTENGEIRLSKLLVVAR